MMNESKLESADGEKPRMPPSQDGDAKKSEPKMLSIKKTQPSIELPIQEKPE
ncbi:hypothetical protein [Polynucleobacter wuianus]|uniref:hypothetical protein n=1 Tax=Polynucleobacter wuianus TaxID=1743168 RepID=UPI000AA21697|nr:hypothetical protein [Polynucleobacter wuianus]